MNKKGFTLIEVLATVIILATICLVSFPVIRTTFQNNTNNQLNSFKKNAELAADTYLRIHQEEDYNISFGNGTSGISSYTLGEKEYLEIPVTTLIKEKLMDKPNFDYDYKYDSVICSKKCEYGETDIKKGTEYTIKDEEYITIRNSFKAQDYVVLMKKRGLSISDINTYGVGYINKYTKDNSGVPLEYTYEDGYRSGGVAYYSSSLCGYINDSWVETDCKVDYNDSDIIHIVNNWSSNKFNNGELKEVDGYKARLITFSELKPYNYSIGGHNYVGSDMNTNFAYWIMPSEGQVLSLNKGNYASQNGSTISISSGHKRISEGNSVVESSYEYEIKPVINYQKSLLEDEE